MLVNLELESEASLGEALALLTRDRLQIQGMASEFAEDGISVELEVRVPPGARLEPTIAEISHLAGVRRVRSDGL